MPDENFVEIVEKILRNDLRYPAAAYEFINDSVRFTIRKLQRDTRSRRERHVCGAELIRYNVQQKAEKPRQEETRPAWETPVKEMQEKETWESPQKAEEKTVQQEPAWKTPVQEPADSAGFGGFGPVRMTEETSPEDDPQYEDRT